MKKILFMFMLLWVAGITTGCSGPIEEPGATATMNLLAAVSQSERTAAAAIAQVDIYSQQLTATAGAPLAAMTTTAGAWQMQMAYASGTSLAISATETAVQTKTAQAWTSTPNATSTMVAAQAASAATQIANQARLSDLAVERAQTTNLLRAASVYVIGFTALVAVLAWSIGLARKHAIYAVPTSDRGDKLAIVLDGIVMDVDRLVNGAGRMAKTYIDGLPDVTAERQDSVTSQDQIVDLTSRMRTAKPASERVLKSGGAGLPSAPQTLMMREEDIHLPLPPWEFLDKWDGTSKPLGFGRTGLILAKSASPHILISGMTGSGKTIYMMRTLATASLATGALVINIGYSDSGYGVFKNHANYHSVNLAKAESIIECLASVYDELRQRKQFIGGDLVEWEYWPGGQPPKPFVDLFMDELGNMAEDIYMQDRNGPSLNKEMWSLVARIANEGRKVGIRFVAALQDPTAKSLDLRFRRNCTLVAFRQGDRTQSDAFIGSQGAEKLSIGHFMARTDTLVVGGGFSPSDAEILQYLGMHKVGVADKPTWITEVNQPQIEPTDHERRPADEISEMAERIRRQWSHDMSGRQVAKLLGLSQYGGSLKTKTDKVIEYLTATTTVKQPEIGSFAPEMA